MTRKYNIKHIYMKNYEICKNQKQYKIDTKDILSKKKSLYYQENFDFIREKQSQYYLEKSHSTQEQQSIMRKIQNRLEKCSKITILKIKLILEKKVKFITLLKKPET